MTDEKDDEVILVVDDSSDTVSMLNDALEAEGFSVLVALSGMQAVSICRKIVPDLILMDAVMPEMDGFETCRKLKSDPVIESVPVIFMTGLDSESNVESSFDSGAVDYIQKPIRLKELIARIRTHTRKSRQLTLSRELLDSVGLSSIASDKNGNIRWMTPKATEMFEKSGIKRVDLAGVIPSFLRKAASTLQSGNTVRIPDTSPELTLKFDGLKDGLYIFNLIESKPEVDETSLLCEHFSLTEREGEVLYWVSQGKSNKELAMILGISPRTVNKHLESIFEKMLVENRTTAAGMALKVINSVKM